jgi:D-alanine transaminase
VLVYLNGEYLPRAEARVPIDDRGFLFADGVYEVIRIYDGRPFLFEDHIARLGNGLRALRIKGVDLDAFSAVAERLIAENGLQTGDASLYLQVTRGAAPRAHQFPPPDVAPTVFASAQRFEQHPPTYFEQGVSAITVPDSRWARCDIKSISLLPNVLANQQAHERGAFEALFVRDGIVLEGSHSNLFMVFDDGLVTYPASNYILAGITRRYVLGLAQQLGIPAREGLVPIDRLLEADELFLSGTTTEIMPVVRVDGRSIGSGSPGPQTRRLQEAFRASLHVAGAA